MTKEPFSVHSLFIVRNFSWELFSLFIDFFLPFADEFLREATQPWKLVVFRLCVKLLKGWKKVLSSSHLRQSDIPIDQDIPCQLIEKFSFTMFDVLNKCLSFNFQNVSSQFPCKMYKQDVSLLYLLKGTKPPRCFPLNPTSKEEAAAWEMIFYGPRGSQMKT